MNRPSPLPGTLLNRAFTLGEARAAGVPKSRLSADDLSCPSRGIRLPRTAVQLLADLARSHTELNEGDFASHVTAAQLHGIPLPGWAQFRPGQPHGGPWPAARISPADLPYDGSRKAGPEYTRPGAYLHLSRQRHRSLPRRRGVAGHRLQVRDGDLTVVDGVLLTTRSRTWVDLATMLPRNDLIAAGDALVSAHRRSFGTPRTAQVPLGELAGYAAAAHGVHGVKKAREALSWLRVGVDSPPETYLRLLLLDAGLPEFTPNCPVTDLAGRQVWTDLGCPEFRTCLEYEGLHHLLPEQQALDAYRDERVALAGWRQVKVNKTDMAQDPRWIVRRVASALRSHGWRR